MSTEAMSVALACPILPSSPYYTAQHLQGGEQRDTEDSCEGPEAAVHVWQGGVPSPGVCSSCASGMQWCWVPARAPGPLHAGMATTTV